MLIPPRFLEEIRARVPVSEIVGRSVRLTRAGREFKGCCPFHHEKTPSFTVNDDKQFYHCFGCGAHGDVISFVQQNQNVSFMDAVEMLSGLAGLAMPKPTAEDTVKSRQAKNLYDLMEAAAGFFQVQLLEPKNRDVLDYIRSRGVGDKDIQLFGIGYAPSDRQVLRKFLSLKGFKDQDMIEAGVIKQPAKGDGEQFAFFNDRLMFPVSDMKGRVVAFGGRALPEHMRPPNQSQFQPPKYINSGDTALFDKGRVLYGGAQARKAVGDGLPVLVTEGYMDVIACHRAGFRGAVAPMGTALTEEQIIALWRMIPFDEKVPILCFDGDNAGRKAAARAAERVFPLLKPHHSVRIAFLPEGQDPDSLIASAGAQALQRILDVALPLVEFLWMAHTTGRNLVTPEARAGAAQELRNTVSRIADAQVQKHYKEIIENKITTHFFARRTGLSRPNMPAGLKPRPPVFKDLAPRILMAGVINHPHIYEAVEEEFGHIECINPRLESLRRAVSTLLNANQDLDKQALLHHLTGQGFEKETGDILSETVYVHAAFVAPSADSADVQSKWQEFYNAFKEKNLKTA